MTWRPRRQAPLANASLAKAWAAGKRAGFSLIFMSILLTVAALVFASYLPGREAGDVNQKMITSEQKLEKVEEAMRGFMAYNGRRPCPADGKYPLGDAHFGLEAAGPGNCQSGTPAAPFGPDATTHIVGGVIPTRSLNLPDEYGFDEWGRRFTYVVDQRATSLSSCIKLMNYPTNNGKGGIKIESHNGVTPELDDVMYAYISHGPDGFGAFPAQGSTVGGRINNGSTDGDQQVNAGVDGSFNYSTANFTNVKVQKSRTPTFDDLVWYRPDLKNTCCLGVICDPPGFRVDGTNGGNAVGFFQSTTIPDLIVGQGDGSWYGPQKLYVIFGTSQGFSNPLELSSFPFDGTHGFIITDSQGWPGGSHDNIAQGGSILLTDVNGDSYPDLVIGVSNASQIAPYAGAVYVLYGGPGPRTASGPDAGWPATFDLGYNLRNPASPYYGHAGFVLDGSLPTGRYFGVSIAVGNISGRSDGKKDFIIGNATANGQAGTVYVAFAPVGSDWPAETDLSTLNGTNGFRIDGVAAACPDPWNPSQCQLGISVAAGDVNHDGADDIIMAARQVNIGNWPKGAIYILFGGSSPVGGTPASWPATFDLTTLNGTNGTRIDNNNGDGAQFVFAAGVADINGDGIPDLIMVEDSGFGNCDAGGTDETQNAYVYYGHSGSWPAPGSLILPSALNGGANGFTITGISCWNAYQSWTGLGIGDVNRDGRPDILIGNGGGATGCGSVWALFQPAGGAWPSTVNVSTLSGGTTGVRFDGSCLGGNQTYAGGPVGVADINVDGRLDTVIQASGISSTYVVYGRKGHWPDSYNLSTIDNYLGR